MNPSYWLAPFCLPPSPHHSCKTCILNCVIFLAQVTLIVVTAVYAEIFEEFQHVKQLNATPEITHNMKACYICMLIQKYITVHNQIPVSLI
jgi:hypothetical protein